MLRRTWLGVVVASIAVSLIGVAGASAAKKEPLVVCKHGCKYSKIQKAVDASGKKDTIQIKPGTYREGVIVSGKSHNGLTIEGTKKNAKKVVLNGKGKFNNAIEGLNVNKLRILNLTARKYAANGFFVHDCADYLMKNLRAEFNRSYGLFSFNCTGGRMTKSIGFGHGDSAFYVGATPVAGRSRLDEPRPPAGLRERARLLRHELQVRANPPLGLLQQRDRRRAEHARLRAL